MNMTLYPHNQQAYEAVMKHYGEGNRKAAVIQSTGTGKSFVGGAVASHFGKVLVVAPNEYVINQAVTTTPHADTATYSLLSIREEMPTGYDLIWFDEFHRIGAPTWRSGVDKVIAANPNAKILGTTATPDRSLEQRNMADELFEGDVVSNMTLTDAWVNRILRVPKYVIGVISMGSTQADYKERINSSKRIDSAQKKDANALLDNIVRDWSCSYGVPRILRKYIDEDVERMIVFAQTINKLDEVVSSIRPWFNEAGIKLANVYSVHSGMGEDAKRQLEAFENDDNEGVKVLVCVDMLNEGIHVDRVDAVMLLRSTISKNLYMQQIGRCFAVGQKHQPIILDLADNLTSACGYEGIYNAQRRFEERDKSVEESSRTPDEFMIIDTLKETRELIAKIDKQIATRSSHSLDECLKSAKKYNTRTEWCKGDSTLYWYAKTKDGWFDICTAHMIVYTPPTLEECIISASYCKTKKEWERKDPKHYSASLKNRWHEICCAHMVTMHKKHTLENCMRSAKRYKSVSDWVKNEPNEHSAAKLNGWYEQCIVHMTPKHKTHTLESCLESSSKFSVPYRWMKADPKSYKAAKHNGWYEQCIAHMKTKNVAPSFEKCYEESLKYKTRMDLCKNNRPVYDAIRKNKWQNKCFAHMNPSKTAKKTNNA